MIRHISWTPQFHTWTPTEILLRSHWLRSKISVGVQVWATHFEWKTLESLEETRGSFIRNVLLKSIFSRQLPRRLDRQWRMRNRFSALSHITWFTSIYFVEKLRTRFSMIRLSELKWPPYPYIIIIQGGERGLVAGRWTCNPEVPGSNSPPCHWMDLSSVAPNSTPPRLVNSQLVSLPPVGILNLLCQKKKKPLSHAFTI